MSDVLIRDIPDEVLVQLDQLASRLGLSRPNTVGGAWHRMRAQHERQ